MILYYSLIIHILILLFNETFYYLISYINGQNFFTISLGFTSPSEAA